MSIFTTSKLNEVFYKVAKFPSDSVHAFIHAPFDRVTIGGHTYVTTRSYGGGRGGNIVVHGINGTTDLDTFEDRSDRDMFYTELNPIVMGAHEFGDFQGRADDWVGCFQLGLI